MIKLSSTYYVFLCKAIGEHIHYLTANSNQEGSGDLRSLRNLIVPDNWRSL
jgi:hypothetical protein